MHKLLAISASLSAVALGACGSSQAFKDAASSTPFVMDQWEHVAMQRPSLPANEALAWTPRDRLYNSVTVDFIEGMSQGSYWFTKPNQEGYRKLLAGALWNAGLLAPTPQHARYSLQISFEELKADGIGLDFAGQSKANYRLVKRSTGEVVFSTTVEARFLAIYPRLNERDLAKAYDISKPGVVAAAKGFATYAVAEGVLVELVNNNEDLTDFFDGPIEEDTQATWTDVQQAYVWTTGLSLIAGPLTILLEQLDPTNYVAFSAGGDELQDDALPGARHGYLSEQGFGSRDGRDRARQASTKMMGQSITKFVIDLARSEEVRFRAQLPCTVNPEVEALKIELMKAGHGYSTGPCRPQLYRETRESQAGGVAYTTGQ